MGWFKKDKAKDKPAVEPQQQQRQETHFQKRTDGGALFTGGKGAAWATGFKLDQPKPGLPNVPSDDDILAGMDDELMNPVIDDHAWQSHWFREAASKRAIQSVLHSKAPDGTFLITEAGTAKNFDLYIRHSGKARHLVIEGHDDEISLRGSSLSFSTLTDFVCHYKQPSNDFPCPLITEDDNNKKSNLKTKGGHVGFAAEDEVRTMDTEKPNPLQRSGSVSFHGNVSDKPNKVNRTATGFIKSMKPLDEDDDYDFEADEDDGGKDRTLNKRGKKRLQRQPTGFMKRQSAVSFNALDQPDEEDEESEKRPRLQRQATGFIKQASLASILADRGETLDDEDDEEDDDNEGPDEEDKENKSNIRRKPSRRIKRQGTGFIRPHQVPAVEDDDDEEPVVATNIVTSNDNASDLPPSSIMKTKKKPKKKAGIRFDDDAINHTQRETKGIYKYVDSTTMDSGLYLGSVGGAEPLRLLRGRGNGAMYLHDSPKSSDALKVTYHDAMGNPMQLSINVVQGPDGEGVQLQGTKAVFKTVGALINYFAGDNEEKPNLFNPSLTRQNHRPNQVKQRSARFAEEEEPAKPTVNNDHLNEPWFAGHKDESYVLQQVEFEPSGTFMIRETSATSYLLYYCKNGRNFTNSIPCMHGQYELEGSGRAFSSLVALVEYFYEDPEGYLECPLRPPKSHKRSQQQQQYASPTAVEPEIPGDTTGAPAPLWLLINISKAEALQVIMDKADGAFVVRSSESRSNCYVLSYKYKDQIFHELIHMHDGPPATFSLEIAPSRTFDSLRSMVQYYEEPRPELKFPLRPCLVMVSTGPRRAKSMRRGQSMRRQNTGMPAGGLARQPSMLVRQQSIGAGLVRQKSMKTLTKQPSRKNIGGDDKAGMLKRQQSRLVRQKSFGTGLGMNNQQNVLQRSQTIKKKTLGRSKSVRKKDNGRLDTRAKTADWCCMTDTKNDALRKLNSQKREGAFIVRENSIGQFATLSVIVEGKMRHYTVEDTGHGVHIEGSGVCQPNLSALVAYYKLPTQGDLPHYLT
eukprot:m.51245 g.51245  ORF g.51245 m.51245 type:complete len:1027 (-) comp18133_c0_seq2:129-3209(-)